MVKALQSLPAAYAFFGVYERDMVSMMRRPSTVPLQRRNAAWYLTNILAFVTHDQVKQRGQHPEEIGLRDREEVIHLIQDGRRLVGLAVGEDSEGMYGRVADELQFIEKGLNDTIPQDVELGEVVLRRLVSLNAVVVPNVASGVYRQTAKLTQGSFAHITHCLAGAHLAFSDPFQLPPG
jgi:hypothetical protein